MLFIRRTRISVATAIGVFNLLVSLSSSLAQENSAAAAGAAGGAPTVCAVNQFFNGQTCTCAPGYFSSSSDESKGRCEDECEEVYFSYFTYGKCVDGLFDRLGKAKQPACNLRCGIRFRTWATVGIFCLFAAAIATLVFTIPMCVATCASCLHSRKLQAVKHTKRVYAEQQQSSPNKDQQLQAISYNPYAYWPYYGRG